jgi:4-hydroxybenzoate polyprenyltransferase
VSTSAISHSTDHYRRLSQALVRALRPAQWIKNGLVFAGLVFGGKLFDLSAVGSAVGAAVCFCALSSGFYLINDIRDADVDRLHPEKRLRPVASGSLAPLTAGIFGAALIVLGLLGSVAIGFEFLFVMLAYAALMAAYNLGLKQIVILDVFAIATGFVLRAVGGAIAVDVAISPWLLVCTMLLALLISFGKRRHELVTLEDAGSHRHNLHIYTRAMLDQSVAITAAGTLIAYAVYTFAGESVPRNHGMMLTIPIVTYGIFRYLFLLYQSGQGGAPESMLFSDRALLTSVIFWSFTSVLIFYISR